MKKLFLNIVAIFLVAPILFFVGGICLTILTIMGKFDPFLSKTKE